MIHFYVPGKPQSQGSKIKTQWGMREASKELGPWRERVALAAHGAAAGQSFAREVPVAVGLEFVLYRPASTPKSKTPAAIKAPDADKLTRACLDAMTHVLYADDAQVITLLVSKRVAAHGEGPGVYVWVVEAQNPLLVA